MRFIGKHLKSCVVLIVLAIAIAIPIYYIAFIPSNVCTTPSTTPTSCEKAYEYTHRYFICLGTISAIETIEDPYYSMPEYNPCSRWPNYWSQVYADKPTTKIHFTTSNIYWPTNVFNWRWGYSIEEIDYLTVHQELQLAIGSEYLLKVREIIYSNASYSWSVWSTAAPITRSSIKSFILNPTQEQIDEAKQDINRKIDMYWDYDLLR